MHATNDIWMKIHAWRSAFNPTRLVETLNESSEHDMYQGYIY